MTKISLSDNRSIEGPELKEIPVKDWLAEGERLFGANRKLWKWKCPNCGHVQTIADFIELRKLGIIKAEQDVGQLVYYSCIGRFDSRIPKENVGTIFDKIKKSPCNYTLGGLFCFANTFVISESGERIPVFEFAEETIEMVMIGFSGDWRKSNDCLEGCSNPIAERLIAFQSINNLRLEGAELIQNGICPKCGNERKLYRHHIKYGKDEQTKNICGFCHQQIHKRIRREGLCPLTPTEVAKLSRKSYNKNRKKEDPKYRKQSDKLYFLRNIRRLTFSKNLCTNIQLEERVSYNLSTGNVGIFSHFVARHGKKLIVTEI